MRGEVKWRPGRVPEYTRETNRTSRVRTALCLGSVQWRNLLLELGYIAITGVDRGPEPDFKTETQSVFVFDMTRIKALYTTLLH